MPDSNIHAGRVRNPEDFIKTSYGQKKIAPGISLVIAKLKSGGNSGPMTAESYHFDKDKFTPEQAKAWLKKNKIKTVLFEPAVPQAKEATMNIVGDSVFEKCFSSVIDKKKKKMMEAGGAVVATGSNLDGENMDGSLEKKMQLIRGALRNVPLYGKYPSILSTFDDYVFVESDGDGPTATRRFYKVPYSIEDGTVKLGAATEIEKVTKFVVKEMREEIIKGLFVEGGAGSGNYGHKGRPGHRGGSLGGKGGGVSAHIVRGSDAVSNHIEKNFPKKEWERKSLVGSPKGGYQTMINRKTGESVRVDWTHKSGKTAEVRVTKGAGGGGGTAPHVVGIKGGQKVKASQFFDKSGNIKTSEYKKLTDNQKGQVLKHGLQKYTESYVPAAKQGGMSDSAKSANRKVGELEGVRRAMISRANKEKSGSKEWRSGIHAAIGLQVRVGALAAQLKGAGQLFAGKVIGAGRMAIARSMASTR